jgi:hypothetical protein
MTDARAVPPPIDGSLATYYPGADLVDAFAIPLPSGAPDDVMALARALWGGKSPLWIRSLVAVRDAVMGPLGAKTFSQMTAAATARGPVIGSFPILSQTSDEVIAGDDDRDMEFRAATLVRITSDGGRELVAVTAVRCHNSIGRLYLMAITPFHRAIVKTNLRRAARSFGAGI